MKKYLLLIVAVVAVFASCKKVDPIPQGITLKTDAVVDLKDSNFTTIEFTASAAWAAEIVYGEDDVTPFVTADVLSGEAGDGKIKLTVQSLPDSLAGRYFGVIIGCDSLSMIPVSVMQGKVFKVALKGEENEVGAEGGSIEYAILSNCTGVTFTPTDADWATSTYDKAGATVKMTAQANGTYDARATYASFTVSDIQVPVYDPTTGEPTQATENATYSLYLGQSGQATFAWCKNIDDILDHTLAGKMSIAVFDGKIYVCDGVNGIFAFNKTTGVAEGQIPAANYGDIVAKCITTDDAGHLLVAGEGTYEEKVEAYVLKNASTAGTKLLSFYVDAWNGGTTGKFRVTGDLTGKASVVAFMGGLPSCSGVSYTLKWQITGGSATWAPYGEGQATQPEYFEMTNITGDVWDQNGFCVAPVGSNLSDGLYYMGYEGRQVGESLIYYFQQYDGSSWIDRFSGDGAGNHGYSSIDVTTWNSKKYIAVIEMAFFPFWGESSNLFIVNADNNFNIVSKGGVNGTDIRCDYDWETYSTTGMTISADAEICVEDGKLTAYVVDGGQNVMYKKVFDTLK